MVETRNMTFRFPEDVAGNLDIVSSVTGKTRTELIIEGAEFVIDKYVNDPNFQEEARKYLEKFSATADTLLSQPPIE